MSQHTVHGLDFILFLTATLHISHFSKCFDTYSYSRTYHIGNVHNQGHSVTFRNEGLNCTMLRSRSFLVADPDWKRVVYIP